MDKPWKGRGFWVWYLSQTGELQGSIDSAKQFNADYVLYKEGDDGRAWNQLSSADIETVHTAGLKAVAWIYAYGADNDGLIKVAKGCIDRGYDGIVLDTEAEIARIPEASRYLASKLREVAGEEYPLAIAPVPVIKYFPGMEYDLWYEHGYDMMPQFYVNVLKQPDFNLEYLFSIWLGRFEASRIYPVFGMYAGDNGYPTVEELREFVQRCIDAGMLGWSYWRLDTCDYEIMREGDIGMSTRRVTLEQIEEITVQLGAIWGNAEILEKGTPEEAEIAAALKAAVAAVSNIFALNS